MNLNCSEERLSSGASIFLSLWFSLSGLAAVVGNATVLGILYKKESLRTISNRFLASLSVADFFVGLVLNPIFLAKYLSQPQSGHGSMTKIIQHILWIHSAGATSLSLCCASVDRLIAIRFPYRYQEFVTKTRCHVVITAVWVISLFLPFLMFIKDKVGWLFFAAITYLFPIFVVILCYAFIFKAARTQGKRIKEERHHSNDDTLRGVVKNFKAIKTIGLVLSVCIITWIPCFILTIIAYHYSTTKKDCLFEKLFSLAWPWVGATALTSSAINPLIYYFRNGEFRQAFCSTFSSFPCLSEPQNVSDLGLKTERKEMATNDGTRGNFGQIKTEL